MSSGPVLALELEAEDAIAKWRALIGPTNSETARKTSHEASPEDKSAWTLRALYGTDGRRNACHGSDSKYSASREVNFFFPTAAKLERTLAMIKPDAVKAGAAEEIIKEVVDIRRIKISIILILLTLHGVEWMLFFSLCQCINTWKVILKFPISINFFR